MELMNTYRNFAAIVLLNFVHLCSDCDFMKRAQRKLKPNGNAGAMSVLWQQHSTKNFLKTAQFFFLKTLYNIFIFMYLNVGVSSIRIDNLC